MIHHHGVPWNDFLEFLKSQINYYKIVWTKQNVIFVLEEENVKYCWPSVIFHTRDLAPAIQAGPINSDLLEPSTSKENSSSITMSAATPCIKNILGSDEQVKELPSAAGD